MMNENLIVLYYYYYYVVDFLLLRKNWNVAILSQHVDVDDRLETLMEIEAGVAEDSVD